MKDEINLQVTVGRKPTRRQLERHRLEVKMAQIRTRQAECMVQLLGSYAEQLSDQTTERLVQETAENLLQIKLPEQPLYSLQTVAAFLNASPEYIDRLTDEHGLRNPTYGRWVTFRSAYTGGNIASFRYYDHAIAKLQHTLASQMRDESCKAARALREAHEDTERLDWLASQVKSRNLSLVHEPFDDGGKPSAEPLELWQKDKNGRSYLAAVGRCLRELIDSAREEGEQNESLT